MLVKLVVDANGYLDIDKDGIMDGRSGYLCPGKSCFDKAFSRGRNYFARIFRKDVKFSEGEELWNEIKGLSLFTDKTK